MLRDSVEAIPDCDPITPLVRHQQKLLSARRFPLAQTAATKSKAAGTAAIAAPTWRDVWQVPALGLAAALLVGGVIYGIKKAPSPEFGGVLAQANEMINKGECEQAIDELNRRVLPYVGTKGLHAEDQARYHALLGRAVFEGQRLQGLDREENYKTVIAQFSEAEKLGATLKASDAARYAESLAALGKADLALERADGLPQDAKAERVELYRALIGRALGRRIPDFDRATELLVRYLADGSLKADDRIWGVARQAQVQLSQGYPDAAITRLLREVQRVGVSESGNAIGEVYLLLAKAYLETDAVVEAEKQLQRAADRIELGSEEAAEVILYQGKIAALRGELPEAREKFESVVSQYEDSKQADFALLGLGEVEASRGEPERSLDAYGRLVKRLSANKLINRHSLDGEAVAQSLLSRYAERRDANEFESALRFAEQAELLYTRDEVPAEVAISLAVVHKKLAEEKITAMGFDPRALELAVDPATLREVQAHYLAAGEYFKEHRNKVVITDIDAYEQSLWNAADCLDRAGDQESAVIMFKEHVQAFASTGRAAEGKFRLGRAYQARGEAEGAGKLFRELVDGRNLPGEEGGSGPWGDDSFVPLAQALLADSDPSNDTEAEANLLAASSGTVGGPETATFREAVVELGSFYYNTGQYSRAIEKFEEASERYASDPRISIIRYKLADSHRLMAAIESKRLQQPLPESDRAASETWRMQHLEEAYKVFGVVRASLEEKDSKKRSGLEELCLRNSMFFIGDAAFDLGNYEVAVDHYEGARERYPSEPSSLVAMTQIVNAYIRLGDSSRAATVNNRARTFYKSLPESVWDDPNLPMTRRDWERWLDATDELTRLASGKTATGIE